MMLQEARWRIARCRRALKAVTDGEFRRDYWHPDFLGAFQRRKLDLVIEIADEVWG